MKLIVNKKAKNQNKWKAFYQKKVKAFFLQMKIETQSVKYLFNTNNQGSFQKKMKTLKLNLKIKLLQFRMKI